jgi:hypothetical protein
MTTNVDSKLHADGGPDREGDAPKRALRGAAGGVYIGPARINSGDSNTAHATGVNPGGADGSTGYRKRNGYFRDGDATGSGQGGPTATARRTGRTLYTGAGVQGGSTPGRPIASGSDHLMTGNFDKRASIYGDAKDQLGAAGRGTTYQVGTADPVETGTKSLAGGKMIPAPTVSSSHNPSSGVVTVGTGTAAGLLVDMHADDVTGGANGRAGAEVFVFALGTDTDTEGVDVDTGYLGVRPGGLVKKFDVDSATEADVSSGLTASTTYAIYVRFIGADGNVGPLSIRYTATTHA